jgi:hypothetical protein
MSASYMPAFDTTTGYLDPHAIFATFEEDECAPLVPAIQDRRTGEFWELGVWMPVIQDAMNVRLSIPVNGSTPFHHAVGDGEGLRILASVVTNKSKQLDYRVRNQFTTPLPNKAKGKPPRPCIDFQVPIDSFEMSAALIEIAVCEHVTSLRREYNKKIVGHHREETSFREFLASRRDSTDVTIVIRECTIARLRQAQMIAEGYSPLSFLFVRGSVRWSCLEAAHAPDHAADRAGGSSSPARPWEFS